MHFYCSTVQTYCYFAFAVNPPQNRLDPPKILSCYFVLNFIMFLSKIPSFAVGCFV
jgi:hypothetical protein